MNTKKYKSIAVPVETYELIRAWAREDEKNISKALRDAVVCAMGAESDEANLDSALIGGGTPRLKRLKEDLWWFRKYADIGTKKRYIIDAEESKALDVVIEAVFDTVG